MYVTNSLNDGKRTCLSVTGESSQACTCFGLKRDMMKSCTSFGKYLRSAYTTGCSNLFLYADKSLSRGFLMIENLK